MSPRLLLYRVDRYGWRWEANFKRPERSVDRWVIAKHVAQILGDEGTAVALEREVPGRRDVKI